MNVIKESIVDAGQFKQALSDYFLLLLFKKNISKSTCSFGCSVSHQEEVLEVYHNTVCLSYFFAA